MADGEMAEWLKARAWKARVPKQYRGFESLSLRQLYSLIRRRSSGRDQIGNPAIWDETAGSEWTREFIEQSNFPCVVAYRVFLLEQDSTPQTERFAQTVLTHLEARCGREKPSLRRLGNRMKILRMPC